MAPLLIISLALIAFAYFKLKTRHLPSEQRKALSKKWFVIGGIVVFALIAVTKGNLILGFLAGLTALATRLLPLLKYVPLLQKILGEEPEAREETSSHPASAKMTRAQAADVLGISENATKEEVIAAHRSLIQKVHPDRGGSTNLAMQINQAKKILLEK
ncbi:MAG: DnaJ domain-containing protein [Arenicella sp.]